MIPGYTADAWTLVIVALSIFGPLTAAAAITIVVLRGKKDDPDEQRWKHESQQRREAEAQHAGEAESEPDR